MKTTHLKNIRKYWDYKFITNGSLVMRRKADGEVRKFDTIETFMRHWLYENPYVSSREERRWRNKKKRIENKRAWDNADLFKHESEENKKIMANKK